MEEKKYLEIEDIDLILRKALKEVNISTLDALKMFINGFVIVANEFLISNTSKINDFMENLEDYEQHFFISSIKLHEHIQKFMLEHKEGK